MVNSVDRVGEPSPEMPTNVTPAGAVAVTISVQSAAVLIAKARLSSR